MNFKFTAIDHSAINPWTHHMWVRLPLLTFLLYAFVFLFTHAFPSLFHFFSRACGLFFLDLFLFFLSFFEKSQKEKRGKISEKDKEGKRGLPWNKIVYWAERDSNPQRHRQLDYSQAPYQLGYLLDLFRSLFFSLFFSEKKRKKIEQLGPNW